MKQLNHQDIIRLKKEIGFYWTEHPVQHLSLSPRALKKLGVRVIRRGIHEARKIEKVAAALDTIKGRPRPPKMVAPKAISFTTHQTYDVSIVIPVFNKLEFTRTCLGSIAKNIGPSVRYQVIVADNASSDGTQESLSQIPGLTYIRNNENLGFVGGCNAGASHAKGKYIVFLNNDAYVTAGWLEWLHRTIESDKTIGLVGSKIVYPNGKLQEAGGIIFSDASGYNFGKHQQANAYEYNYVRDVDYCSGASIIISKKLFDRFGGFDELYAPAYYEDTDLAFKTRKAGLRVVYQPLSLIYHIEGATSGTSTSSGFKKYQDINKVKFEKRWRTTLNKQCKPGELYLARDRRSQKLALIIDENIPRPDEDSGSVRMLYILKLMTSLGYKVTFFPLNTTYHQKYTEPLQQLGIEVVYGNVHIGEFLRSKGQYYDVVILSRARIAAFFMDYCRAFCKHAKVIYDTVDLHYLRLRRQAEYDTQPQKLQAIADAHEAIEKHLMQQADATLVVSDYEQQMLQADGLKNIHVLSNIHEIDESAYRVGFNTRKDLVFVGGYAHPPNVDGVRWFAHEIFPLIRKQLPRVSMVVVGSHMPDDLRKELESTPGVVVKGFVENLKPLLYHTRVFVAPLRYGAGVKGKIGLAIEHGIPVVSTAVGAEGMKLVDGTSCLIGDDTEAFASAVVKVYKDQKLWFRIQKNAKVTLAKNFSLEKTFKDIKKMLL